MERELKKDSITVFYSYETLFKVGISLKNALKNNG